MKFRTLSILAIFSGALIAQAGSSLPKSEAKSDEAGRLLKEMSGNAEQIRSSAHELERLAKAPDSKWQDYDYQWNIIKPAQERIDLAMLRMDQMQASLSPSEQEAFSRIKGNVEEINRMTHDLWTRIGQQKVDLKAPALNADARGLDKAAREIIKAAGTTS